MVDIYTPNAGFLLPTDASPMSDVNSYLNNNWTKVEGMGAAKVVATVPDTDDSYAVGDRIWVPAGGADPPGIYTCIGMDFYWGHIWRPVTAPFGPWRRPGPVANPSSVIQDTSTFKIMDTLDPFQYRLTNKGKIQFRGCIQTVSGTWPDVTTFGYYSTVLTTFPECIRPGAIRNGSLTRPAFLSMQVAPFPVNSSTTTLQAAQAVWAAGLGNFYIRVFSTGLSTINKLYFSGCEYNLGDMNAPF